MSGVACPILVHMKILDTEPVAEFGVYFHRHGTQTRSHQWHMLGYYNSTYGHLNIALLFYFAHAHKLN